jgi:isochorismate synthase EntC
MRFSRPINVDQLHPTPAIGGTHSVDTNRTVLRSTPGWENDV